MLLDADPAVVEVRTAPKGGERTAVVVELERRLRDLVVSTTRYDGIPAEIERRVRRSVTDLWRRPPPDESVSRRYLRILAEEGLVDGPYAPPRIHLTNAERTAGVLLLAELVPEIVAPVVLVPDAGMDVKVWPHRRRFVADLTRRGVPVLVSARTCRRCTCAGSRRSARRSATVAEPSSGRTRDLRVAGRSGRPDRWALRADSRCPLRPRPSVDRPAGPAGLPAPPSDHHH